MTLPEQTDHELLTQFRLTKCEVSFAELVRRYSALVYCVAFRVLGNRTDAEDAVQAAFIALAIKSHRLDARSGLGAWLHTVTVRAALDLRKSNERRIQRHENSPEPREKQPPYLEKVDDLVRQLPDKLRIAIVKHYIEGHSVEEIARAEECSPSAITMRLTRGREKLRSRLGHSGLIALGAGMLTSLTATDALAVSAQATATAATRALAGLKSVQPALSQILAIAHQAVRPTLREILRPAFAGIVVGATVVTGGVVATSFAESHEEKKAVITATAPAKAGSPAAVASDHPLIAAIRKNYSWMTMNAFTKVYDLYKKDINRITDAEGRTALHIAILKGHEEFTALMIIDGANVNQADSKGYTPLMYAVKRQMIWTQLLLVLKGAEVNHVAKDGVSPLSLAIGTKDPKQVELLLWTGADPRGPGSELAKSAGDQEIASMLEEYQTLGAPSFANGSSSLPDFVRNPLHEAAKKGNFPMLQSLLSSGYSANTRDEKGRTPLHEAIGVGQFEVAFYLLMMGADPNALDNQDRSPLDTTMGGLGSGIDATRRFLLAKGANPNAMRKDGHTTLTWAVVRDNEHGVQWLLWRGVDPRMQTKHGTPFEIAVKEGNQRLIDLFRRNGVDGPTRLSDDPRWILDNGAKRGDIAAIDEALDAGAKIDEPDAKGNTPLLYSIFKRNVTAARHLLERGADVDFANPKNGETPLFATMCWDYHEMTEFREDLLEAGVDPNIPTKDGTTPLMRGIWYHPTMPMKQLIKYGADLNARDAKGRTVLTRTIKEGKTEMVDYLRSLGATE